MISVFSVSGYFLSLHDHKRQNQNIFLSSDGLFISARLYDVFVIAIHTADFHLLSCSEFGLLFEKHTAVIKETNPFLAHFTLFM